MAKGSATSYGKRKASDNWPDGRDSRIPSATSTSLPSNGEATLNLFKRSYARDFDLTVTDGIKVENESDESSVAVSSPTPAFRPSRCQPSWSPSTALVRALSEMPQSESRRDAATCTSSQATESRENAFVPILVHQFDAEVTQLIVSRVIQSARESAGPEDELGLKRVQNIVARLDQENISKARRKEVIDFLQQGLKDICNGLYTRIKALHSPTPSGPCSIKVRDHDRLESSETTDRRIAMASESVFADIPHSRKQGASELTETSVPSESSSATAASDKEGTKNVHDDDGCSKPSGSRRDHEISDRTRTLAANRRTVSAATTAALAPAKTQRSLDNLLLYGTLKAKTAFDIFARCAITACANGLGDEKSSVDIRGSAHNVWRRLTHKDKSPWEELFKVRRTDAAVFDKGQKLLESQGLISRIATERARADAASSPTRPSRPSGFDTPSRAAAAIAAQKNKPCKKKKPPTISQKHADRSGATMVSKIFPAMTHATSSTPSSQPCFVPFSGRSGRALTCIYVVNTPDTNPGSLLSEIEIRAACKREKLPGFVDVVRHNYNVFEAIFATFAQAKSARDHSSISVIPATTTTSTPLRGEPAIVRATFHLLRAPRVFVCYATDLAIDHDTVSTRVLQALAAPDAVPCKLFRQENFDTQDDRIRYILRFSSEVPAPHMERFYIPLDAEDSKGKVWAIFKPANTIRACDFCEELCQQGIDSSCAFAHEVGSQ